MHDRPFISIIVAVLNRESELRVCLDSITAQNYPHREILVKDGGSTDGSISVIQSRSDAIAHWETGHDRGIYHAWNTLVGRARGDWICFLGADDRLFDRQTLERIAPHLTAAEQTGIGIVYGKVQRIDTAGSPLQVLGRPWESIRWQMRHGMPKQLPHPGMMHHRRLFDTHGLFDDRFRIAGDYDFLLRELKTGSAYFASDVMTSVVTSGGLADANERLVLKEVAMARVKNGLGRFSWVWTLLWCRLLIRKMLNGP